MAGCCGGPVPKKEESMSVQDLTIAYITGRRDPKLEWFLDSLDRQIIADQRPVIIVVDFFKEERPLDARGAIHLAPKPNVWQGPHRLTKEHWFAVANARNTGLCRAPTKFIAYVDDVSILMPNWLQAVRDAIRGNYFVFGAYQKATGMVVEKGELKSHTIKSTDNRYRGDGGPAPCGGGWLYGCSLAGPVDKFLQVGGWPECMDGMGFEDCCMGFCLQNNQFDLKYDPRMMTIESEDNHASGDFVFRRTDKGVSPSDKSHAALDRAHNTRFWDNYFPGGIHKVRQTVLEGNPFPVQTEPTHDWYDKQPIAEMT
jgi:glycosyltransferase involved in cell wall biosynthesis